MSKHTTHLFTEACRVGAILTEELTNHGSSEQLRCLGVGVLEESVTNHLASVPVTCLEDGIHVLTPV